MVVAVGVTVVGIPPLTAPMPLSIAPAPFAKTAVNVVELPLVIIDDPAVKLVITGAGTTVTVTFAVTLVPNEFVTVSVYVVVDVGETLTPSPLVAAPTP